MPTLATGADRRAAGFTLVELMVVLVIMGLVATAVVLSLPNDEGASLNREAGVFAAHLKRAQEEAVLTNRPVAVSVDAQGYAFRVYRQGEWAPLQEGPFQARRWSRGVTASMAGEGGVRFDPTGVAEPAAVTLSQDGRSAQVAVSAEGRVVVHASRA